MNILLIVIVTLVVLFLAMQFTAYFKSKKFVGQPLPFDNLSGNLKNSIKDKNSVLYFYAPNCHACKQQSPVMEELKKDFNNIFIIDASKNVSDARAFGIMGTPSTIFIKANQIKDVMIGFRNENVLRKKLAEL